MLLFNFIITLLSIWVMMFLNYNYLRPVLMNRKRFQLFAIRDRLALLAMRGELSENSVEYITLMMLINSAIKATSNFRLINFLRLQYEIHSNKSIQNKIKKIEQDIESGRKINLKYKEIAYEYFDVMGAIIERKTWLLRRVLIPILLTIMSILAIIKLCIRIKNYLIKRMDIINELNSDIKDKKDKFSHVVAN